MIYFIRDGDFIKIGYSNDVRGRLSNLQISNARMLEVIGVMSGEKHHEAWLHTAFDQYKARQGNEWFFFSDAINRFIVSHTRPYDLNEARTEPKRKMNGARAANGKAGAQPKRKATLVEAKDFVLSSLSRGHQRSSHLVNVGEEMSISRSCVCVAIRALLESDQIEIISQTEKGGRVLGIRKGGDIQDHPHSLPDAA